MGFFNTLAGAGIGFLVGGPAGAVAGASIGGGMDAADTQADAAESAANATAAAANRAADLQYKQWQESVALQEPWRKAGMNALAKLEPLATEYTPFGMEQFQQDPGYAFRMSEGMKGLERSAAARGGLLSGATLKGIQRYGQDLGSQEYQNAFNRYQTERNARLEPLQSLAGVGQTSATTLGDAGQNYATRVGNIYAQQGQDAGNALLAQGQARSSSYQGIGNALGGLFSSGGYGYQQSPAPVRVIS